MIITTIKNNYFFLLLILYIECSKKCMRCYRYRRTYAIISNKNRIIKVAIDRDPLMASLMEVIYLFSVL